MKHLLRLLERAQVAYELARCVGPAVCAALRRVPAGLVLKLFGGR